MTKRRDNRAGEEFVRKTLLGLARKFTAKWHILTYGDKANGGYVFVSAKDDFPLGKHMEPLQLPEALDTREYKKGDLKLDFEFLIDHWREAGGRIFHAR